VSAALPSPGPGEVVAPVDDRLAAVDRLEATALGSRALQRLAELAVRVLGASSAVVSLIGDVELIVGGAGLAPGTIGRRVPLEESLCAAATASGPGPYVVPEAVADPRVAAVPAVVAGKIGAYLGMPLTGPTGEVVGALCVLTPRPRPWTDGDVALIRQLADSVATELELSALSREFEAHRLRLSWRSTPRRSAASTGTSPRGG
jgi:GAF domain-containing protein